jgi:methionine sulfoxide reductase heme-binding subunit
MTTSAAPHLFWITSRAAGIVALVLASLAVSLGLMMSTKLMRKRGPDLLAVHEILSLSAIAAVVVHGLSLIGDTYLHPTLADVAIPFLGGYKTFWTSMGIIAGWGLALLGLSYYARRRIGAKRWRKLHRFTALFWAAGLAHSLGEGTDAGQLWFEAMVAIVAVPAVGLLFFRHLATPAPQARTAAQAAVATSAAVPAPRPQAIAARPERPLATRRPARPRPGSPARPRPAESPAPV